jgi:capsular exopolysaccharide synthesis family protein
MELRQYISLLVKWLWLMVLAVVIAAASSYVASKRVAPLYRTHSTLIVGRVTESLDVTNFDMWTGEQLASTYAQMAEREPVLQGVVESLGLDVEWRSLTGQVSAEAVPQSLFLEISVVDTNPQRAKAIADAVAQQLILISPSNPRGIDQEERAYAQQEIEALKADIAAAREQVDQLREELDAAVSARRIQELEGQTVVLEGKISGWQSTYAQLLYSLQGGEVNVLAVVEQAGVPSSPFSPNVRMNVILASALALALAAGGALVVEYLDDTIKSPEDATRATGLPSLAGISRIEGEDYPDKLIAAREPLSPVVEAYRVLRTNIQFSSIDAPIHTLMVTSSGPTEGKSVTLTNLAIVMAQSGRRVVVVDSDLRRPVIHRAFGVSNNHGLSDVLVLGIRDVVQHLQETGVENLWVLPAGTIPPNPAELLGSQRMKALIEQLTTFADVVLFDSPPSLVVADSAILGTSVDGVLLVCDSGRTRRSDAERAANELRRVGAKLLGVVLNRVPTRGGDYYYHYRYYRESGERKGRQHSWWHRFAPEWLPESVRSWRGSRRRAPAPAEPVSAAVSPEQDFAAEAASE